MNSTEQRNPPLTQLHITKEDVSRIQPLPTTPLLDLDPLASLLDRCISNPLVRGYSNLSVQSDEGAHFVPYGRGHVEIANQQDIQCNTSMELSSSSLNIPSSFFSTESDPDTTPIQIIKSKVQPPLDAVDTDTESISSDVSSLLIEPLPNDAFNINNSVKSIEVTHNAAALSSANDDMTKIEIAKQELSRLLKEWKLEQYIKVLIHEMGYDDIQDWKDIEMEELNEMNFKPGHAKRFIRKTKGYFERM